MENANDFLRQYTGTERYHQYLFGMILTDGVLEMANWFQAFWLIDLICSYQPLLRHNSFQVWQLTVDEDGSATVVCSDGNGNILERQYVPYTTFSARTAVVWVEGNVLLLPTEH